MRASKKAITEKFLYFVFLKLNILLHNIVFFLESNLR